MKRKQHVSRNGVQVALKVEEWYLHTEGRVEVC